ncbi:MAG: hypothetical protein WCH11_04355, partial [Bdellovibrio sp.]
AEVKPQLLATGPQTGLKKGSLQELEKARRSLRENPQNKGLLEELLQVEKSMGHLKMVSYLQGRLELLEVAKPQSPAPQRRVQ